MKAIKDPVHGYIQVESALLPLLDSPELQRLRYVRQLGFSYLVYPGAHHTRFEHSLGTMHLASLASHQLGLSPSDHLLVTSAALLHDIGHGPFSHAIEGVAGEVLHWQHTDVEQLLSSPSIQEALSGVGVAAHDLQELIAGSHPLAGIIHGDLDVDRMDYLLRDAHYTGVPYGTVDAMRLIRAIRRSEQGIMLHESGIQAAESLLIARTLMRPSVYYHHVSRIAEKMFASAVYHHTIGDPSAMMRQMIRQDDMACMQCLLTSDNQMAVRLMQDLYCRRLYKRALYIRKDEIWHADKASKESFFRDQQIAEEIAEQADVAPHEVLVDTPAFPRDIWMEVQVRDGDSLIPLEELSPLITTLNETRRSQWRLGVYAPEPLVEQVKEAAKEVLNVRQKTQQRRLTDGA